jgi:signal transduction histidine kinase
VDARTQSALLAAIVCLALAVAMLLRQGRTRLWTSFALLNLSLLAYQLGDFLQHVLHGADWVRLTLAASGVIPPAVLGFLAEFQGEAAGRAAGLRRTSGTIAVLVLVLSLSPLALIPSAQIIVASVVFVLLTASVYLLYARMRRAASRTERARLFYLWVGAALCVGLSAGELLLRTFSLPAPPFANVALTVYLYFLSQTIQRHRLLDLNELLGKIVVLASVGLVLAAIYGLLVRWTGTTGLFLFNTLVASFVILILFEPLKAKVEERVLAIFFAERFQLVQALQALRAKMASTVDVRLLAQVMLDGIYETRRVTHASLYLLADDGLGYKRLDFRGPAPAPYIDLATLRALVQSAQAGQKAQLVELVERRLFELRQLLPDDQDGGGAGTVAVAAAAASAVATAASVAATAAAKEANAAAATASAAASASASAAAASAAAIAAAAAPEATPVNVDGFSAAAFDTTAAPAPALPPPAPVPAAAPTPPPPPAPVRDAERAAARAAERAAEAANRTAALAEERTRLSEIGAAMAAMRAGVAIPLVAGSRVVAFLCLLDDRVPEAFASDELAAMLEVADQAAITIENSRLYERMKERDRLAALGEMAAGLAHEIRNPLGAIKGAAQYLDPKSLPAGDGEILGIIVEEVNRLDGVVAQFLEYSRPFPQAGVGDRFQPTDLNDVISRTLKLLEASLPPGITLNVELGLGLPKVTADADQLKQVFINLAINAVQAMPDGGTLSIRTRRPAEPLEMALSDALPRYAADQVEVRIADTGAGIPEEAKDRIFIPFYTTKTKGTGLGLAISQRIVKGHGGTIEVQSRLGEGTEFILRFPSATALDTAGRLGVAPTPIGVPRVQAERPQQKDDAQDGPGSARVRSS